MSPQDNLIDEVDSIITAAQFLKENGAYKVYAVATHGILSRDAPEQLEESPIEEVGETPGLHAVLVYVRERTLLLQIIVTNTLPTSEQSVRCSKIRTIDVSMLLGEAIRRVHYGESMSYLFANVPGED